MIVIDASALVEILLGTAEGQVLAFRMLVPGQRMNAPFLVDVEVASAFRRMLLAGFIGEESARSALNQYVRLSIVRHGHTGLLPRIWELRHNLSACDAAYVALAETLGVPLITHDARLFAAASHYPKMELI
jgi:predicted nucleic acid-binding protein